MTSPASSKHMLLFGDQSVEKLTAIKHLVRASKSVPAAKRFLREATDVIQLEFSRLGRREHGWEKTLDSLLGMAEDYDTSNGDNIVASTALACAGRLGHLICHADQDPTILGSSLKPVDIIALCGGLLPAAVAMAAQDTNQLFSFSREVLSIAIRLAYEVSLRMKLVEESQSSWGRTYTGLPKTTIQHILDSFHESQAIPEFRKIAIGVAAKDWVTLIGPPSSLERLATWSPEISDASHIKTEVAGPIHTKYAPRINVAKTLGTSPLLEHPIDHTKARMLSPGSCKQYKHLTLGELLREAVEDIAHNVLHVTDVINACVSTLDAKSVQLSVMGPTNHLAAVKLALQNNRVEYQITQLETPAQSENTRGGSDLIAVIGMAGRFPGSETVEGFWEDLVAGKCHIKEVPKSRFDIDAFFDATGKTKNSTASRHGAWLDSPGLFDYRLFNVSPREAAQMDPGHRLILMIAYEALQAAGYSPEGSLANGSTRIASYFGQAADEWREILNQKGADIYYVPGFSRAFGVGRLNYHFNWSGGAFSLDTACSTSATAVSLACSALIARECDMALAGGCSVINSPTVFSGLGRAGMLSTTDGCRTFHEDADGYARAEGAGLVILKRLEDAVFDNDNILAVISGSTRMHSPTATSMTHPSALSQEATYKEVLRQSGLNADEIAYVEMHGTGTQAGDVEEMASVVNTFANQRRKDNPLTVGAVKAAVGHGEGAAGVTSLIKTIMMLRERMIPPQPGWPFKLNPKFPALAPMNVKIATRPSSLRPSSKGDKRIKILVNSFDASGGNTCLTIEEAPLVATKSEDVRAWHTIAISGRTAASLEKNRERLLDYLERNPDTKLADLAYTTTARRIHEPLRLAYTANSLRNIISQLRGDVNKQSQVRKPKPKSPNCVFFFTGQGSHYAGMGADLFRESKAFREAILSYQEMATMIGLPYFVDLISDATIDTTNYSSTKAQLAIVALEIALAHVFKLWGIAPSAVIGHSLGEYAALCVAGVLSISDTLLLIGSRATLMEKHLMPGTYAMLITNLTEHSLEQAIGSLRLESCSIACVNAPSITVASGKVEELAMLQNHMEAKTERASLLHVPYGFHSGQVEPILKEFRQFAKGVVFSKPEVPLVSTLTGRVERQASTFSPEYLALHARQKVNFVEALKACKAEGLCGDDSLWIEMGPAPICLGHARQTLDIPLSQLLPVLKSGDNNWKTVSEVLSKTYASGLSIFWSEFHKSFKGSLKLLNLPLYAFDTHDFWTPYVQATFATKPDEEAEAAAQQVRKFLTTSLQYVENEVIDGQTIKAEFSSNISDAHLLPTIQGHVVNGQTVCPLGVFHDMALTAADYVYKQLHSQDKVPSVSIQSVDISQALVITEGNLDTAIVVTTSYDANDGHASIQFYSKKDDKLTLHGKCEVTFETNASWNMNLSQSFLLMSRVNFLQDSAKTGNAHRLMKPVIYQLFSGVVSYTPIYQALEEVIMDASYHDAIGTVKLANMSGLGKFRLSPYWVDAVIHLAGFVVNSGLRYPQDVACLATGFDSWHSINDLKSGSIYTIYVCMQEIPNSHLIQGDCYVFQGSELVQATLSIKFLKLKKVALSAILAKTDSPREQLLTKPEDMSQRNRILQVDKVVHRTKDHKAANNKHKVTKPRSREEGPKQEERAVSIGDGLRVAPESAISSASVAEVIKSVVDIVATESGCNLDEMADDTRYADLGIDSVMTITILAKVTHQIGLDLPAAFFLESETIGDSKRALEAILTPEGDFEAPREQQAKVKRPATLPVETTFPISTLPTPTPIQVTPISSKDSDQGDSPVEIKTPKIKIPPHEDTYMEADQTLFSRVIQYQESRSTSRDKLFIIADESGSTFELIHIPALGANLGLYGVESPLTSENLHIDIDIVGLANVCKTAIQREQPCGPYMLGGLSAGAVLAFEVARQLLEAGEEVKGLLLLDCSSTKPTLGRGMSKIPSQQDHAQRIVSMCTTYFPSPFPHSTSPRLSIQILAKGQFQFNTEWASLIPGLETRHVDIDCGSFLQVPVAEELIEGCRDILKRMRQ